MSLLVLTAWPASVVFVAVLGFRIGVWWSELHRTGRHTFIPRRSHRHGREQYRRASGLRLTTGLLSRPSVEIEDHPDRAPAAEGADLDTDTIPLPPAVAQPPRSGRADANTEILPRLQDIRPPTRATPIRRPPWVG